MKRTQTPSCLRELPLCAGSNEQQVRALREAGRCLCREARTRLRYDAQWQQATTIPRSSFFEHGMAFSEAEMHAYANVVRVSWIACTMAQTLATRASQGCVGKAQRVRLQSKRRERASVEGQRNDVGRVKESERYQATRGQPTTAMTKVGNRLIIANTSSKGGQKRYGRSSGLRALGMLVAHLTRKSAKTGGTPTVVSTLQTTPSITRQVWATALSRFAGAMEQLQQRARQHTPRSVGVVASRKATRARARRHKNPLSPQYEPVVSLENAGSVG